MRSDGIVNGERWVSDESKVNRVKVYKWERLAFTILKYILFKAYIYSRLILRIELQNNNCQIFSWDMSPLLTI